MNEESRLKKLDENAILCSIIFAFRSQVFYDIEHSWERWETTGLLAASIMEKFSGYLFLEVGDKTGDKFVEVYMPEYKDIGLYRLLQNPFDGKLPAALKKVITKERLSVLKKYQGAPAGRALFDAFVRDFGKGLKAASEDLSRNEERRQAALAWFRDHPVEVLERWSWYSDEEMHQIHEFYIPAITQHPVFKGIPPLSLGVNFGDKGYLVNVCLDKCFGRKGTIKVPLELFIGLMGLKQPAEVLGWEE